MPAKKKITKKTILLTTLILLVLVLGPVTFFQVYFWDNVYPGVQVASVDLSRESIDSGSKKLEKALLPPEQLIVVGGADQRFTIATTSLGVSYDYAKTAQKAYLVGRSGNLGFDVKNVFEAITQGKQVGLEVNVDEQKLETNINVIASTIEVDPIYPSAKLEGDKIVITQGKSGVEVDKRKLRTEIGNNLAYHKSDVITIDKKDISTELSPSEEVVYKNRLEKLKTKSLKLSFEEKDNIFETFDYAKNSIFAFIKPQGGYTTEAIDNEIVKVSEKVNRQPQNPVFEFSDGKVKEFQPAKPGITVNPEGLRKEFIASLAKLETDTISETNLTVPTTLAEADIETSEVNNLGVVELIGRGTSTYHGSVSSRLHNIAHATQKINGVLIKPGETFSFNDALGEVTKATGYQEAYVIQNGRTVLGDGGGVCQVSTTLFRAAMNAGLSIAERHNHSYRVGYYEQDAGPGLDATVFAPSADLKLINDTPGHILIQAKADTKNATLVFELYGTKDGRVAAVTKPVFLSQTPAPPDVYIDDPSLPAGTVKQVEKRIPGAKTSFDYTVTKDGQQIYKKTFLSVYKPWAAVYMRGPVI